MVDLDEETYNKISRQNFNSGRGTSFSHFELFLESLCVVRTAFFTVQYFFILFIFPNSREDTEVSSAFQLA